MSTTPDGVVYDWCAAYSRLLEAYHKVMAGGAVRSVRHRNGEDERQTDFSPANVAELRRALVEARNECQRANGGRPKRSAIGSTPRFTRSIY